MDEQIQNADESRFSKAPLSKVEEQKSAFMERFEDRHTEKDEVEQKEPEAQPVSTENSASSSDKEEIAKPAEVKTPEGYVRKEALDEERSRRKRESQKRKELEAKIAEFEKKLAPIQATANAEPEETDQEKIELRNRLKALESRLNDDEESKQRKAVEAQQNELNTKIKSTDESLRKEGYPGFKLAVMEVDSILKQMLANDEIDEYDYLDPNKWQEVYREKVYPVVREQFGIQDKKRILSEKLEAKTNAARVTSSTGIKQEESKKSDEEEALTPDQEREEYMKFKRQSSPRRKFQ